MKIRRILAGVTFLIGFGASALMAQPGLKIIGGDTFDWGKVLPGKLEAQIQVTNTGNQQLNITEVRPQCGCTVGKIDKYQLASGDTATISISLDAVAYNGPVEKLLTIGSNDPVNSARQLHLKATIHRPITCTPPLNLLVNDGKVGIESAAVPMTIKNTSDTPITFSVPELIVGGNIQVRFDMTNERTLQPGEAFELKTYVTPLDPATLMGRAQLKTSNNDMPLLDIQINGIMTPQQSSPK